MVQNHALGSPDAKRIGRVAAQVAVTFTLPRNWSAVGLGQHSLVGWLRRSVRYINRVSGFVLILAGSYIVWFWGTTLASGADALNSSGPFRFIESLSQTAFQVIGENTLVWGLGLGAIILGAVGFVFLRSEPPPDDGEAPKELVSADSGAD